MLVLVLDSSTPAVTVALAEVTADEVRPLAARCTVDARAHGELLAPQITAVLAEAGAAPADLAGLVAGLGPGPFTGLRAGLVTAASIAHALGIPAYGVNSLDALGRDAAGPGTAGRAAVASGTLSGRTLVATDARRREIYWAVYSDGVRVTGPAVDTPAAVAAALPGLGVTVAVGDGALRYADQLGVPVLPEPRFPAASRLAELAADRVRAGAPTEPLTPCYLRRPDAVAATTRKPVLT
ncbi:tRNA (adenosine(37)-N6)-threonylcarbamoyltransferase complex dimerization subunit type 1 TsaB [Solwaraspora sp. WMMD406]|uniref:tRNA (adenosine(37)-N6)-threonylcarbamoyltransferase complex dimerization subunit type 1 TsaB n=1 Tax=Solwaraspora sp. WMMD406 TaxID=3016095 RepID=UPI0024164786|nr:tRNA (adenosine(37)-N6)-threonylcarbamoyltransferase complex dimerization subunit type 1 TsaB [Solwaraspora sp. WMMD406]MDG4763736.1 tRNA (adenosine(37)-N6)-threonylcarbamoyltransferase complex dimerization subunit type 1 TsaB [Solwaraspora sp. WMMD406]